MPSFQAITESSTLTGHNTGTLPKDLQDRGEGEQLVMKVYQA
jgi:hypothetical protein